tara:strand:+ start:236 stop:538 length:303 start_codon:yes stop_codon:yes gene_type:complete
MYNISDITKSLFLALMINIININFSYAMKGLNIDIMFSWEYGFAICILSLLLIALGVWQGKKKIDDITYSPIIKPTTKLLFGGFFMIFGLIQLLPLLKLI